ncbi:MAG: type II secretion system F family protein [Notoacmeibacter sp.]|nr:type II secretion system F family protein [Notoacmeibacter sp.]
MIAEISPVHVIYAAAAISGILIAEAAYLLFAGRHDRRSTINRRLRLQERKLSQKEVLIQLRKERGSSSANRLLVSLVALRRLKTQSGLIMPLGRLYMICAAISAVVAGAAFKFAMPLAGALFLGTAVAPVLPLLVLRTMRKRRHKLFGVQLPEALELITRSLKAGHPVPVAVSLVAREMPDPIGTEFGMVSDEVTYGSDLVTALASMYERVGQDDLPLFVTAVSIQSSTGGNLREILDGLSTTIRERGKLRRKIRAISTEGRMSAYILTAVPVLLLAAILATNRGYYEAVIDKTLTWYLLGFTLFWLVLGNLSMSKMSNFKF